MMHIHKFAALALALLVLLGLTAGMAWAGPPAQSPDNGKALWEQNSCQKCHGAAGEGMWAGPLAGSTKTAQEWLAQVRSPRQRMPQFSPEQVSDQAVTDMHAYLISLPKPQSFKLADAGLPADAPAGQKLLVEKKCVACHTATGPVKAFEARKETPTAEAVIKQLRTPKQKMPMFTVQQVSDAEAALVAEFLASEMSPAKLPETGSSDSPALAIVMLLSGGGLLLAGLVVQRLRARS